MWRFDSTVVMVIWTHGGRPQGIYADLDMHLGAKGKNTREPGINSTKMRCMKVECYTYARLYTSDFFCAPFYAWGQRSPSLNREWSLLFWNSRANRVTVSVWKLNDSSCFRKCLKGQSISLFFHLKCGLWLWAAVLKTKSTEKETNLFLLSPCRRDQYHDE